MEPEALGGANVNFHVHGRTRKCDIVSVSFPPPTSASEKLSTCTMFTLDRHINKHGFSFSSVPERPPGAAAETASRPVVAAPPGEWQRVQTEPD